MAAIDYTADNYQFALTVEPGNKLIKASLDEALQCESQSKLYVTDIAKEKQTNIFLRSDAQAFSKLRKRKDSF